MVSELIWKKDGNGKYAYYKYDIAGRLGAKLVGIVNDGEITCGNVIAYAYDAWGRLEKVNYDYLSGESNPRWPLDVPVSIVSGDVTYTYELPDGHTDVGSRLRASMSDSSGTSEYTYDLLGRQKTYKPPVGLDPGFFVEYDYNSAGQKTRIKITNGTTTSYDVTYGYFANGWLKEVKYNGDMVASYEYDAVGNRLTQTNGNGTSTEYAYDTSDSRHFLNSITHKRGSTVLAAIDYTRDDSGNPLTMTDSIGTWNYGYDANNRLVGAVPPNPVPEQPAGGPYEYDWVGNRVRPPRDPSPPSTTNQMVYNKADQLVTWPGMHTYTYYGDGSLQYEKNAAGTSVLKSYTYTPDGLLLTATFDSKTLTNTWDADKNRVGFTVNSTNHTFVYDISAGIPAVIQEDGIYYIREPAGELIARLDGPNMNYYHFDQLGSTRLLTSSAGAVTDGYSYDAYGGVLSHNRSTGSVDQPYQYVGQLGYYTLYQETSFGLLLLGVRLYDCSVGRFTQIDPVHDELNWYMYVDDAPLTLIDPKGLMYVMPIPEYPGWGDPLPFNPGLVVGDRIHTPADDIKCVKDWMDWWKRNHPWSKKHPPKYGENMDKIGHCFVTCKAIKDCGLGRKCALGVGGLKELGDFFGKTGADSDDMAANRLGADIAGRKCSNCLPDCLKAVQAKYGGVPPKYLGPWDPRWEPN